MSFQRSVHPTAQRSFDAAEGFSRRFGAVCPPPIEHYDVALTTVHLLFFGISVHKNYCGVWISGCSKFEHGWDTQVRLRPPGGGSDENVYTFIRPEY